MVKEMAAIVAVAAQSRGIGYKGDLVRTVQNQVKMMEKILCHCVSSFFYKPRHNFSSSSFSFSFKTAMEATR